MLSKGNSGDNPVRITFGMIVLNGEPFLRYNLRSLYPFAHQIIVVEGASYNASDGAKEDGHSIDRTLEILRRFKTEEDSEHKLQIITAEDCGHPNGFWPGEKDEQSQAYAVRATGTYLWQIDCDEFYQPQDMEAVIDWLKSDASITQMNFRWLNFWGSFGYVVHGFFIEQHYRDLGGGVPRLFKWGEGYRYTTHRPPTVINKEGVDLKHSRTWISGSRTARRGIYIYHYGSVFPKSVGLKMQYYQRQQWSNHNNVVNWFKETFDRIGNPYRIHHVTGEISWIQRFTGIHPPQVEEMTKDVRDWDLRTETDLGRLTSSFRYQLGAYVFERLCPALLILRRWIPRAERTLERLLEILFRPRMPKTPNH